MKIWLIHVRDRNFYRLLSQGSATSERPMARVQVAGFPPLGIQILAPVLRQNGHSVRMFDTCHPQMTAEQIAATAGAEPPDVTAISFLSTTTYPEAKALARRLKRASPDTRVIVGGPFASINGSRILRDCPWIDCVGIGEGEELLPDYASHLRDPGLVPGLVWRSGDEIVENLPRPLLEDLNRYPNADRNGLPIDFIEYMRWEGDVPVSREKFCTVQTSRGCPFSCIYCDNPAISGGKWRARSAEHVLAELQELHDLGYRSIYLCDDHFLLQPRRVRAICEGIVARHLGFHWGCQGRVDSAAVSQFSLMRSARCTKLAFGIEAGTQKMLDRLGKRQTLEQVERAVREAKKQGIEKVHGFFVVGSPDETEQDILSTFRFAARLRLDTFNFNPLCVFRGTPLWREYIQRRVVDDDWDWFRLFRCSDIDPTAPSADVVSRVRRKGYALLFARRLFCRPISTFRLVRDYGRQMTIRDVMRALGSRSTSRKPLPNTGLPWVKG